MTDRTLDEAVREASAGLVDANLGGHLVKKRVRAGGRGKRGGVRTIIATRFEERWFFLYGFEKNQRSNVSSEELKALRVVANELLDMEDAAISELIAFGEIIEMEHGQNET